MVACDHCGDDASFRCSYCGAAACGDHRLPENHDCPRLYASEAHGPDFREYGPDKSTADPNHECIDCGAPVKRHRIRCRQCQLAHRGDEDDSGTGRGTQECLECGRPTSSENELCVVCSSRSGGAPTKRRPTVTREEHGSSRTLSIPRPRVKSAVWTGLKTLALLVIVGGIAGTLAVLGLAAL